MKRETTPPPTRDEELRSDAATGDAPNGAEADDDRIGLTSWDAPAVRYRSMHDGVRW